MEKWRPNWNMIFIEGYGDWAGICKASSILLPFCCLDFGYPNRCYNFNNLQFQHWGQDMVGISIGSGDPSQHDVQQGLCRMNIGCLRVAA